MSFLFKYFQKFNNGETPPIPADQNPNELLITAIELGIYQDVKDLLDRYPPQLAPEDPPCPLNINYKLLDNLENTPLTVATLRGDLEIMKLLLSRDDADLASCNIYGSTALHLACLGGKAHVAELLLHDGRVDADLSDVDNSSPLWDACYSGYVPAIEILIASGRQMDLTKRGKMLDIDTLLTTPLEITVRNEYKKAADLMEQFIKDPLGTRAEIRKKLNITSFPVVDPIKKKYSVQLFALMVLLTDEYLQLKTLSKPEQSSSSSTPTSAFFPALSAKELKTRKERQLSYLKISSKLPLELQMVLSNRTYEFSRDIIMANEFNALMASKWGF